MKPALALILIVFLIGLQLADNEPALEQCQAADHSADVCEFTLR